MADQAAARLLSHSVGASGESDSLTDLVNQVAVYNYHASQILWVKVHTSKVSAAAALAAANATDAVASADETWGIGPGQRRIVFRSPRSMYVALATIGSGAATTYTVEGTPWIDGT